jgi:hypothetical protein
LENVCFPAACRQRISLAAESRFLSFASRVE